MLPAIDFDADMSAGDVLDRLALNGFWQGAPPPGAAARIARLATDLELSFAEVEARLARDPRLFGAAIRRQWRGAVLWYARDLQEVLARCMHAPREQSLIDALDLREEDSMPAFELNEDGGTRVRSGVVTDRGTPVAVSLPTGLELRGAEAKAYRGGAAVGADHEPLSRPNVETETASPSPRQAWPRVDAPACVPAEKVFDVVVGFAAARQPGIAGGPLDLPFTPEQPFLDLTIELSTDEGMTALDGWRLPLRVSPDDVETALARFRLVASPPDGPDGMRLTTLDIRYILGGTLCGTASRPLVVVPAGHPPPPDSTPFGKVWQQAAPPSSSPVRLVADPDAPDLTIEISKPDRNASSGHYVCTLYSPHALATEQGPFGMDLGQDAKTFARSFVDEIRLLSGSDLLGSLLAGAGQLVADRMPKAVFRALHEVAAKVAPAVPAVLIVSVEPFVPWELAWMPVPLDPGRPAHLGAQAMVGRWLRDEPVAAASDEVSRPARHPISRLHVGNLAVLAAWYQTGSGFYRLPNAEEETRKLAEQHRGLQLEATARSLRDLLGDAVRSGARFVSIDAVHFAGHGDFDPARPDASALFLGDGTPLRSMLFRAAKYGGERQPLLFLNACMLGIGGELLGDMAGFPGNSLRGGFGAVLGALWEVDDEVAHGIALEFWRRALPPDSAGEPVSLILRDLRARSIADPIVATYLAYVYYGHPRLTLSRAAG